MILCRCGTGARTLGGGVDGSLLQPEDTGASFLDRLTAPFKSKECWLEIEDLPPIAAIGADWNPRPVPGSGSLCPPGKVLFSAANETGAIPWGPEANGTVVVALRGGESFEDIALNAEASGALAVVLIDNEEQWSTDWEIGRENPPTREKPPVVPMVIVPKSFRNVLCKRENLQASIAKR